MGRVDRRQSKVKTKSLDIDGIRIDSGTQARAALDEATVAEYAEALGRGIDFPPVVVFRDGTEHYLADGFHRLAAFRKAGRDSIQAEVREGTRDAARWYALGANKTHGLRRSNADKRKAIRMALQERPDLSDRAIADHVGVSHPTVAKYRSEAENAGEVENFTIRTGKNGVEQSGHKPDVDPATVPLGDDEPAETDPVPRDAYGEALEPAVAEAFRRKGELTGLMHRLSKVKTEVLAAAEDGDALFTPLTPSQFKADLENAYWQLKHCIPHAACPECRQIGCEVCRGLGYVSEEVHERITRAKRAG